MTWLRVLGSAFLALVALFLLVSLVDVVMIFLYPRFYSLLLFICSFGVAGVFAGLFAYGAGRQQIPSINRRQETLVFALVSLMGILFVFPLSLLEGGEYEPAFKAYGIGTLLGSFLVYRLKPDW